MLFRSGFLSKSEAIACATAFVTQEVTDKINKHWPQDDDGNDVQLTEEQFAAAMEKRQNRKSKKEQAAESLA